MNEVFSARTSENLRVFHAIASLQFGNWHSSGCLRICALTNAFKSSFPVDTITMRSTWIWKNCMNWLDRKMRTQVQPVMWDQIECMCRKTIFEAQTYCVLPSINKIQPNTQLWCYPNLHIVVKWFRHSRQMDESCYRQMIWYDDKLIMSNTS